MRPAVCAPVTAAAAVLSANTPFDNLVVFGDSYSDNGRLGYYIDHGGSAPPPGVYQNVTNITASGGLTWCQFVQQAIPSIALYDYAISGASCSNSIISRYLSPIKAPYPAVLDDEVPSFVADTAPSAGPLIANRNASNTVYALWIGTNDLSITGFLSDSQTSGTNLTSYIECLWAVFDRLYATGARRFVLFNNAPLQLAPMYLPEGAGGPGDCPYWNNKTLYNETEYAAKMMQYTTTINTAVAYGAPFHLLVRERWPSASITLFDVHHLLSDMLDNPAAYLETPAQKASSYYRHCGSTGCTYGPGRLENYLWYDELHPSSQTDYVISKHFLDAVAGTSPYGITYDAHASR